MRNFLLTLMVLIVSATSCSTARYTAERTITEMDEISYILDNYYPQLHEYYMEGVLVVKSIKEVPDENGEPAYNVRYSFCKYRYPNLHDRMEALKTHFPEIYQMYLNGVVDVTSFYKYVDKKSGKIRHHVSFRRLYDFYYGPTLVPYGHTRIYYRPRPLPPRPMYRPTPPRPRPEGNRNPTPRGGNSGGRGRR